MIGISIDGAPTHSALIVWYDDEIGEIFQFNHITWIETTKELLLTGPNSAIPPTWVSIEGSYFHKNAKVYADLNKMLGAIEMACILNHIPIFVGTTAEIDAATGVFHQQDRKKQNRSLAELLYKGNEKLTEDQCDAIAVGIWGWGKFKEYQFGQDS